jgi:hypothetical protein
MQRAALLALATVVAALPFTAARAAEAAPAAPMPAIAASAPPLVEETAPVPLRGGEPAVKETVIEDKGAKIEELRVRGTLQKVVVKPKGSAPGYEVLTSDGYHPTADDPGTSHGSAGKRVWSVLRF